MKVRVWGYKDGELMPDGFEADVDQADRISAKPFGTRKGETATVDALVAFIESLGIEVCIGTDREGESNHEVEEWLV